MEIEGHQRTQGVLVGPVAACERIELESGQRDHFMHGLDQHAHRRNLMVIGKDRVGRKQMLAPQAQFRQTSLTQQRGVEMTAQRCFVEQDAVACVVQ